MNAREITVAGAQAALAPTAWLDVLRATLPARGILVVGAGSGTSPWVQWLGRQPEGSVWLVEGDETQYRHLQRHVPAGRDWVLRRDVVAATAGAVTFYRASNPAESGLIPPERLRGLWPHLDPVHVEPEAAAVTLDDLWNDAGQAFNWLVLDCLPAATMLEGGARLLAQADLVIVRLAADEQLQTEPAAQQAAADYLLRAAGLRYAQGWPLRHPALTHALYVRDVALQAHDLATARGQAACAQNELRQALSAAEQQRAMHKVQLDERTRVAEQAATQARNQTLALEARITQLTQALDAAEQQVAQQQEQAQAASATLAQQQAQQINACKQGMKEVEAHLRTDLGKGLTNAVKQIEAFISIQNYLVTGDGLSEFHGWPISPDLGLFLIERIRERRYDTIIEFGSGTSTVMFAKALQVAQRKPLSGGAVAPKCAVAKSVSSFEHDVVYHRKTAALLESRGLAPHVELTHAPLTEWQDDTGRYLYYDCDSTLTALAQRLAGSPKRLLVLVDGPPGATCPNARYPAVPLVFKHLGEHEIDLVLDDASRPEEKAATDLWRGFWKKNSISVTEESIQSEKGVYFARNYP